MTSAATSPTPIPGWAGADSVALLAQVAETVAQAGLRVVNADCTVVAEAPRLAPYTDRWRPASGRRSARRSRSRPPGPRGSGPWAAGEGVACLAIALLEEIAPTEASDGPEGP